ncbi:MAG TPA: HEAT repeat domain-containing protein [Burkholderiales bacterium]|nr:HEAT repeat domain-containing protein [Burkholderiales bacterium]
MRVLSAPLALAVALSTAAPLHAAPPRLKNGQVVETTRAGTLAQSIAALIKSVAQPAWIGYAVDARPGARICSGVWEGRRNVGELERSDEGLTISGDGDDDSEMSVDRRLLILLRVDNDRIERVRVYTDDCPLDGGSRTLHWLGDASHAQSLACLEALLAGADARRLRREEFAEKIISAIAWHDDPAALDALERVYAGCEDDKLRGSLVFWIGQTDEARAVTFLTRALREDRSGEVREQIVFAISQLESPAAADALIELARNDRNAEVRSRALFWLAQMAGEKAKETIRDAAIDDPDAGVKEQAVFALSQLPDDEGIPLLIEVARNNPSPKVREQAIFWLGQSEDPRALSFFEEILSR